MPRSKGDRQAIEICSEISTPREMHPYAPTACGYPEVRAKRVGMLAERAEQVRLVRLDSELILNEHAWCHIRGALSDWRHSGHCQDHELIAQ